MIDLWEGTVVCHRKALSHISHSQCLELSSKPEQCGSCGNQKHIVTLKSAEKQRERERREECRKLASRRAS